MSHKIAEAIIENGRIKHIDKKLPAGKLKVHIVYDDEETLSKSSISKIISETFGIYKDINFSADVESEKIRQEWEGSLSQHKFCINRQTPSS